MPYPLNNNDADDDDNDDDGVIHWLCANPNPFLLY